MTPELQKEKDEHERVRAKRKVVVDWLAKLAAVSAIFSLVVATGTLFFQIKLDDVAKQREFEQFVESLSQVSDFQSEVQKSLAAVQSKVKAAETPLPEGEVSVAIAEIREKLSHLEGQFATIERAIGENPEKAMSLPLIRRDVLQLTAQMSVAKLETQQQVDRMYDLFKWFIPAFGALALSILGVAFRRGS